MKKWKKEGNKIKSDIELEYTLIEAKDYKKNFERLIKEQEESLKNMNEELKELKKALGESDGEPI